jgi:hypothetical protein
VLVRRGVARRRVGKQQQVPSQKEAEPLEETPDDRGRWREGEIGAQVSRVIVKNSRWDLIAGSPVRKALHGGRRPGFYECSFLTEWVKTGILGFRIRTAARVVRRVTRQLIGRHGADSAVSENDSARASARRGTSEVGASFRSRPQQPTKIGDGGPHPRRGAGGAKAPCRSFRRHG